MTTSQLDPVGPLRLRGKAATAPIGSADPADAQPAGRVTLMAIWLMVVVSLVSWRNGDFFSGGLDPVVLAKALLALVAVVAAGRAWRRRPDARTVGARSVALVAIYLGVALLGGWAGGALLPSLVLSVRVVLLGTTIVLTLLAFPIVEALGGMAAAMGSVGVVCALTGAGSLADGRLRGGLFPLNANDLAYLLGPALLWSVWRLVEGRARRYDLPLALLLLALTWLTESRTGLAAVAVGVVLIVVQARRLPVTGFLAVVAAVPVLVYVVATTGVLSGYFGRGGAGSVASLNSRTIAWQAAFGLPTDFWRQWFGGGLTIKTVGVHGTYWDTQVVDSSWVSAYVQAGVLGLAILSLWALITIISAFRAARSWRQYVTALVAYVLIQSVLTTGLIDAHVLFATLFALAVAAEPATRSTVDERNSTVDSTALLSGPVGPPRR